MPPAIQRKIMRYKRWQDRHAALLGKLLLKRAISWYQMDLDLSDLKVGEFGRPFFDSHFDFNISHSGDVVVCACSTDARIGIDIEERIELDIRDFRAVFMQWEFQQLLESEGNGLFFDWWTKKEAVSKVIGKGFFLSFPDIRLEQGKASYAGVNYFVEEVYVRDHYQTAVASSKPLDNIVVHAMDFTQP